MSAEVVQLGVRLLCSVVAVGLAWTKYGFTEAFIVAVLVTW